MPPLTVMELSAVRLRLRPLRAADLEQWHRELYSDPDVTRYLPVRKPISHDQARRILTRLVQSWETSDIGVWAVIERDTNEFVGQCGFLVSDAPDTVELIYAIGQRSCGKGFATEAAGTAVQHAFDALGVREIVALAFPENRRSIRVMSKLGFVGAGSVSRFGVELAAYRLTEQLFLQASRRP
jgi:ribosomal-protein-alanine N-acetyltransferase